MLKNKKVFIFLIMGIVVVVFFISKKDKTGAGHTLKEVPPVMGSIKITVATTGVVKPQNRLEIKPSINGRLEEILVKEGDKVKKGDVLARMSSTERAALVDAARSQGEEALAYWEGVYKQTPIVSPINGEVIVRAVEPGQTITAGDAVLVLSDRLIVSAQFDETDIGRIQMGQGAVIDLDAYPGVKIEGTVDHIAYESQLINNVNIYDVDILPVEVPGFFRSGMSANVEVVEQEQKNVLILPVEAVEKDGNKKFVTLRRKRNGAEKREVQTGLSDERNIAVTAGLSGEDVVIVKSQVYSRQKKNNSGTNPFMPSRRR